MTTTFRCTRCHKTYDFCTRMWVCTCGGLFDLEGAPAFDAAQIERETWGLWRYRASLPLPPRSNPVTLGEGLTPLITVPWGNREYYCKLEFVNPTGSFKDRGASVLVTVLNAMGVRLVVEDSSGNAGAALAAYAGRAGIEAHIYVPAYTSPAKTAQIEIYGARLVRVPGPRENAARAAQQAAAKGAYYASHYYNPLALFGMRTFAYELWEQLEGNVPDSIVFPVGHGTLLLGTYQGFLALREAGLIHRLPRFIGVQATACAPLYLAYHNGLSEAPAIQPGETVAEGIRIVQPVHGAAILRVVRETSGTFVTVDDDHILAARRALAHMGLYIEPTSAAPFAALSQLNSLLDKDKIIVLPLTGAGLKTRPPTE
ncbi:MAG: threonine synthase [Chloroflexi bacterium]|nr:threonine synthase [Chloroflexota bacterium]